MTDPVYLRGRRSPSKPVFFDRYELNQLLDLYSRRVMTGEWRDYAIDHDSGMARFSIFRHSADFPVFSITKRQSTGRDHAAYILSQGPRKVKQGSSIGEVIDALDRKPRLVWSVN